jgi:hypothetical protein
VLPHHFGVVVERRFDIAVGDHDRFSAALDQCGQAGPPMISADLALFSPLTVIWQAYDNMDLGAYGFDERCYYCYYPIVQSAGFTFIAVDPYLNTYIVNTGVGLYVEKVLL